MKVAVFGDSWAKELGTENKQNPTPAWWTILSDTYDVTNFGQAGSSTYYSYDLFEKEHQNFDKIVFIASVAGRLQLSDALRLTSASIGGNRKWQVTSLVDAENTLQHLLKTDPNATDDIEKLKTIISYYGNVMNWQEQQTINKLYQQSVSNIRPVDSLVINSLPVLYPISKFETDYWGIDLPSTFKQGYSEKRKCHMSTENNAMFSKKVDTWIRTGDFSLSNLDYVTPKNNWQTYFVIDTGWKDPVSS
jgi:hypothetical protein